MEFSDFIDKMHRHRDHLEAGTLTTEVFENDSLSNCVLVGINLNKAVFNNFTFTGCTFKDADFSEALLTDVAFNKCTLIKTDFLYTKFIGSVTFYKCENKTPATSSESLRLYHKGAHIILTANTFKCNCRTYSSDKILHIDTLEAELPVWERWQSVIKLSIMLLKTGV